VRVCPTVAASIRSGKEWQTANQMTDVRVRIYGITAVVTRTNTERSVYKGRDISGTYGFTDVFVKRNGR
jgi:hypothetical protein